VAATIGAAFAGEMAVTASSGPGIALKAEAMGLAVMTELPLVIVNVQRGGPSTGLPTKTEQADLMQAMFGRNGECPMPIIAANSPTDCFYMAIEAWRIAVRYMTPVMLLTDGYIANGSEPWCIPKFDELEKIPVVHAAPVAEGERYLPYRRDDMLSRPWAIPGTKGLMHRIGGLEKQDITGNVSYDPMNHEHMVHTRAQKVANVAEFIPLQEVDGPTSGDLLVVSWGGTYGACLSGTRAARKGGTSVAHCHISYLNPFPKNLEQVLRSYKHVLVAELNMGQLNMLLRSEFLIDTKALNKVQGKPFTVADVTEKIAEVLK